MKTIIVLISSLSIFCGYCQNEKPINIYLKIEIDNNCFRQQKFYSEIEKGIIINPNCNEGGSFLYQTQSKSDTLSLKELRKYKISTPNEIKSLEKNWRDKKFNEFKKSKEKHPIPIHTFDRNYIFNTYIIEIISKDEFVVYPVIWRGEGTLQ